MDALFSRLRTHALLVGLATSAVSAVGLVVLVDWSDLGTALAEMLGHPVELLLVLAAFGSAFLLRAEAWHTVLPNVPRPHLLAGIHLALGGNHVLPLRLGEPLRVWSVVRRTPVDVGAATASTITLRAGDLAAAAAVAIAASPAAMNRLIGPWGWALAGVAVAALAVGVGWLQRRARHDTELRAPRLRTIALAAAAWPLEAVVIWHAAKWAGIDLTPLDAVFITTVAVAAQLAAIAPGGLGTYEAAAVAAFVATGHSAGPALVAALTAHGVKTLYSLLAGAHALAYPSPSMIGRLRLPKHRPAAPPHTAPPAPPELPIVLFMPAHDEAEAIGPCIERVPPTACGRRIEVVVIDDGSTDDTATLARAAGAEVISFETNRGLGAAVRRGLRLPAERPAAALVYCDADGEYPPEEIESLVAPILNGDADYVCGSRFLGDIEHMRPHRRFGNKVLTRWVSFMTRQRVSDGQTGFRAFSVRAAGDAEVIHDFNYAQVLTLDLLSKGYELHEVGISYHFRATGESFVKLGTYLRKVLPAVYRELNEPAMPRTTEVHA